MLHPSMMGQHSGPMSSVWLACPWAEQHPWGGGGAGGGAREGIEQWMKTTYIRTYMHTCMYNSRENKRYAHTKCSPFKSARTHVTEQTTHLQGIKQNHSLHACIYRMYVHTNTHTYMHMYVRTYVHAHNTLTFSVRLTRAQSFASGWN